jgi:crotonobetainyl-CoA:carnitine CoA-transferase CaiB-like acyl-CoA transferase
LNVQVYSATNGEQEPTRTGVHHFAVCPLGLFKAKRGYVCIIALAGQWAQLCRAIGQPELADDDRYDDNPKRCARQSEVNAIVQRWVDSMPSDEAVIDALEAERVPCAPVRTISETVNEPHLQQRGTVRTVSDPLIGDVQMPGMPLRFSGFPHNIPLAAAYLGEHNEQVLTDVLGYSKERIDALVESGVVHADPKT